MAEDTLTITLTPAGGGPDFERCVLFNVTATSGHRTEETRYASPAEARRILNKHMRLLAGPFHNQPGVST
jgi:hypothetical protein